MLQKNKSQCQYGHVNIKPEIRKLIRSSQRNPQQNQKMDLVLTCVLKTLPRLHCFNRFRVMVHGYTASVHVCLSVCSIIITGSKTFHFFVKDQHSTMICYNTRRTGDCSLCSAANMSKTLPSIAHSCSLLRCPKHLGPHWKLSTNSVCLVIIYSPVMRGSYLTNPGRDGGMQVVA